MPRLLAPIILAALNLYFCRELFRIEYLKWMGSIEAAFISIARYILDNWRDLSWFPLWYGGIPFQNTYPPLLHAIVALVAATAHVSPARSYHIVIALLFCGGPVTLYFLAAHLGRSAWFGFWAALAFTLLSPSAFLMPTVHADLGTFWASRRFHVLVFYGEGPHIAALFFLPLAILMLDISFRKRRPLYYLLAALCFDAVVLSNWIGAFALALAVLAWLAARCERWTAWKIVLLCAVLAYALAAPWIPPSTIQTIGYNAQFVSGDYLQLYSRLPLTMAIGWIALGALKFGSWRAGLSVGAQFFLFFAFLATVIPLSAEWLSVDVIPQPRRYHIEMDMALCLAVAAAACWLAQHRCSPTAKAGLAIGLLVLSVYPAARDRHHARPYLRNIRIQDTLEFQTAQWLGANAPGQRVMVPGSVSFWLNAFGDTPQFNGGFDQGIVNRLLGGVNYQLYTGLGGAVPSVIWLQAFGVEVLQTGGPLSREAYRPFQKPERFSSLLKPLAKDGDDVTYHVPGPPGIAHLVPRASLVRNSPVNGLDIEAVRTYVAAIDDDQAPFCTFLWTSRHSAIIQADVRPGFAISVQETYHAGWHAKVNGSPQTISKDGLGQMVIEPECSGACTVDLAYDGGLEMRLARILSFSTMLASLLVILKR